MTNAPPRLFDDPSAPLAVRGDLERARGAVARYDEAQGLVRLQAALEQASPPAASSSAGASVLPKAIKLLLSGVVGAAGVALVWSLAQPAVVPSRGRVGTDSRPSAAVPSGVRQAPAAAEHAPRAGFALREETSSPASTAAPRAPAELPASTVAAPARREIEQLLRIRTLLPHDPRAAYRLALRSEREFPHGALRQEREALRVLALDGSGEHARARAQARSFLQRYPASPWRDPLAKLAAAPGAP